MSGEEPKNSTESDVAEVAKTRRKIMGITIDVFLLGLVSLFTDVSSEIFFSVFPLYLVSLGLSKALIGTVEGIAEAMGHILKGVSGKIADIIGKNKGLIVLGYTLSNLVKPATGLASLAPTLDLKYAVAFTCRITDRVGKGFRTSPRDAIISSLTPRRHRGKSFGIHRAMDTTGAILGPLLAAVMLAMSFTYTEIFLWTLIPGVIAIVLVLFVTDVKRKKSYKEVKKIKLPRNLYEFVLIIGLVEFFAANVSFILIYAQELLKIDVNVTLLYALYNTAYAAISIPAGILSDKFGRKVAMVPGALLFSVGYMSIALGLFPPLITLILAFTVLGLGRGFFDGTARATVGDIVPKDIRARAYGLYYLVVGILSVPEAFLFGYLWDIIGPSMAFMYSGISMILVTILLILWRYRPLAEQ